MLDWVAAEIDALRHTFSLRIGIAELAMRRLLLLRHAKSDRSDPGARNHDRTLNAKGRADMPKIAAYMAHHGLVPERVLISTAVRAQETWKLIAKTLHPTPAMASDSRLYNASAQALLQAINDTPRKVQSLLVVGHNPGLHELAVLLIASGDLEARERLREKLPTGGLAVIDFALDDWSRLHPQSGRLERFVTPKLVESSTD